PYPPAEPSTGGLPLPFGYEPIATFLLTGGRQKEVFGLEIPDVDFERKSITFRPNKWRRLKTKKSHRTVHLWPQLERILRHYMFGPNRPRGELLFPSYRRGKEHRLTDVRGLQWPERGGKPGALPGPTLARVSSYSPRPRVRNAKPCSMTATARHAPGLPEPAAYPLHDRLAQATAWPRSISPPTCSETRGSVVFAPRPALAAAVGGQLLPPAREARQQADTSAAR